MKTMLVALVALFLAGPASAELIVFAEFADIEVSAGSSCPEDPVPDPDFSKYFVDEVVGTSPGLLAEMASTCGDAGMDAQLSASVGPGLLSGSFGASSSLDSHGGGYASLTATISFRVDVPTTYTFSCIGMTGESGDPDFGGMVIGLYGGAIDHSSDLAEEFDLEWSGEFQPGVNYTLEMNVAAERSVRTLNGGEYLFMDGTTQRAVAFALSVGGDVVENEESTVSRVKGSY